MNRQEELLLSEVWKRSRTSTITLKLSSEQEAKAIRLKLYKVARKAKLYPGLDRELTAAVEQGSISFDPTNPGVLLVGGSLRSESLEALARGLGIDPGSLRPAVELQAEKSLEAFQKANPGMVEQGEPVFGAKPNPYYNRKEG